MSRMNRGEFFGRIAALDEEGLRNVMWNLYWRGSATMRERIESAIDPAGSKARKDLMKEYVCPEDVLDEVGDFVALARSGAYLGRDRRVSPRERTRWRFTFQRLVSSAQEVLCGEDVEAGAAAMEQLIDLACEMGAWNYFRSEDPVEAARFVVSDAATLLWTKVRDTYGFPGLAERALPQLIRWESRYGWTRFGAGLVGNKETSLTDVLTGMLLRLPDMWVVFADRYLESLDRVARDDEATPPPVSSSADKLNKRAEALADWHLSLLMNLGKADGEARLQRLTRHPALGGPALAFLQVRVAQRYGDLGSARRLLRQALKRYPDDARLRVLADEIEAPAAPQQ